MSVKTKVHIFMDDQKDIAYILRKVADEIERTHRLTSCIYAAGQPDVAGFYSVSIETSEPVEADDEHLRAVAALYHSSVEGDT